MFILDWWDFIEKFLHDGGVLMYPLLIVTFFLWTFLIERLYYILKVFPNDAKNLLGQWEKSKFVNHWVKAKLRKNHLVHMRSKVKYHIGTIKLLVALAPMIGLLGTVDGMIDIFDVMSAMGTSNARLMAAGISTATITTMVGLVISLSGFYLSTYLDERGDRDLEILEDQMRIDHSGEVNV